MAIAAASAARYALARSMKSHWKSAAILGVRVVAIFVILSDLTIRLNWGVAFEGAGDVWDLVFGRLGATAAFIAFSTPILIVGVGLRLMFALHFETWTGVKLFYVAGMDSPSPKPAHATCRNQSSGSWRMTTGLRATSPRSGRSSDRDWVPGFLYSWSLRRSGGIGRRAWLRAMWGKPRGSSSLLSDTRNAKGTTPWRFFCFRIPTLGPARCCREASFRGVESRVAHPRG